MYPVVVRDSKHLGAQRWQPGHGRRRQLEIEMLTLPSPSLRDSYASRIYLEA